MGGNQYRVVSTHLTDDRETEDIVAGDVVAVATTEETITMTDQDQKELEKKRATTRMTKTDLRLMKDQDDHTEVAAVDAAEGVVVDEVIQDVEDTSDVPVMTTVKVQNTHKTVTDKVMIVNDVKMVTDDHDDSADVHDVHHRAQATKVTAIEENKRNAETATTSVEDVADAVDVQDATIDHVSQEPKGMHLRAANLNAKIHRQMTPSPPQLKLEVSNQNSSCFSTLRCFSIHINRNFKVRTLFSNLYLVER